MKLIIVLSLILNISSSFSKDRGGDSGNGGNGASAEFVAYLKLALETTNPMVKSEDSSRSETALSESLMNKLIKEMSIIPTTNKLCPETTDRELIKDLSKRPFEIKTIIDTCLSHDGLAAKNWPKHKLIILNVKKWNNLNDNRKMALALHETLGLVKIEEGHYIYSSNIIFETIKDIVLQVDKIKSIFQKELNLFEEIKQTRTQHTTLYAWKPIETITIDKGVFKSSLDGHLIPICPNSRENLYKEIYKPQVLVFYPMAFAAQTKTCFYDDEKLFPTDISTVKGTMSMFTLDRQSHKVNGEEKYYRLKLESGTSTIYCSQKNDLLMMCLEKNIREKTMKIIKYSKVLDNDLKDLTLKYAQSIYHEPNLLYLMP